MRRLLLPFLPLLVGADRAEGPDLARDVSTMMALSP
jgi:hypothetical protein